MASNYFGEETHSHQPDPPHQIPSTFYARVHLLTRSMRPSNAAQPLPRGPTWHQLPLFHPTILRRSDHAAIATYRSQVTSSAFHIIL